MPCGQRGEPLGAWVAAQAREMSDEATFEYVKTLLMTKYGEMVTALEAQTQAQGQKYTVLLVEPEKE